MEDVKTQLALIFLELNKKIEMLNLERQKEGLPLTAQIKVQLLGQTSLLANKKVSLILYLAQTGDLDTEDFI